MQATLVVERAPTQRMFTLHSVRPSQSFGGVAETRCSMCAARGTCLPSDMHGADLLDLEQVVHSRRRIRRGEHVYRAGEGFNSLYAVRSGFFKSYVDTPDGQAQVIGFPMAGEVLGLDGIESDTHRLNLVALDDGEVCVIPYANFEAVAMRVPALQRKLHKLMSREIVREQELMSLLRGMRAESRVAAFLLALSEKFAARGYSATKFRLRMTREEIGSYLGLKLETVSRVMSRFNENKLVTPELRSITILDVKGLRALVPEL